MIFAGDSLSRRARPDARRSRPWVRHLTPGRGSLQGVHSRTEAAFVMNDERPKVYQGFLESSNVNPVIEMVNLIEVHRNYEANQRMIQAHDSALGRVINEVGKL